MLMSGCLKQSGMGLHTEAFGLAPCARKLSWIASLRRRLLLQCNAHTRENENG